MAKMVNPHKFMTPEWYEWTHNCQAAAHNSFSEWAKERWEHINSVLEVGCGKYSYYARFFAGKIYTGMDCSQDVIKYRQLNPIDLDLQLNPVDNSAHKYLCADFTTHSINRKFDLVFCHSVIDHARDVDCFLRDCVRASKRWIFIMSYRGWFPDLQRHKQERGPDGFYYNDVSPIEVRGVLETMQCKSIRLFATPTNRPAEETQNELTIIAEVKG